MAAAKSWMKSLSLAPRAYLSSKTPKITSTMAPSRIDCRPRSISFEKISTESRKPMKIASPPIPRMGGLAIILGNVDRADVIGQRLDQRRRKEGENARDQQRRADAEQNV